MPLNPGTSGIPGISVILEFEISRARARKQHGSGTVCLLAKFNGNPHEKENTTDNLPIVKTM
jgi:hypothetical protein